MIMMKGMIYGYDFDDYHDYDEGDDYDEMMNMMNMTMIVNTYKFEGDDYDEHSIYSLFSFGQACLALSNGKHADKPLGLGIPT